MCISGHLDTSGTFRFDDRENFPLEPLLHCYLKDRTHPPVIDALFPVCRKAILLAADEQYDIPVALPPGMTTDDGRQTQAVWEIVAVFELEELVAMMRRFTYDEGELINEGPEFFDTDPAPDES